MSEPLIRRMGMGDLEAVLALEKQCFSSPWTMESLRLDALENRCARYLVAEEDGRIVAYGGFWLVMEEAYITRIGTDKALRSRGVASALLYKMHQLASNLGVAYFTLEVRVSNLAAQRLYEKLGYVRVGVRKRYYEDNNEDALLMVCQHLPEPNDEFADDEAFVEQ